VELIGYDSEKRELWVTFHTGTYVYSRVPEKVWEEFRRAPSKGTFVNEVIKPRYPVRRA